MASLLVNNNIPTVVKPENGTDFRLEELHKLLDCQMFQVIRLSGRRIMIFDEEGKCKPHYKNQHATFVAHDSETIADSDYIAGHALVCKESELK